MKFSNLSVLLFAAILGLAIYLVYDSNRSNQPNEQNLEMVLIDEGFFVRPDNYPVISIRKYRFLKDFYIDRFETTNEEFSDYLNAMNFEEEQLDSLIGDQTNVFQIHPEDSKWHVQDDFLNIPVIGVSWDMAKDYCEWRGKRLPTELEWEKASIGVDSQVFPDGRLFDCSKSNYISVCNRKPVEVGSYSSDVSIYGVHDLAGNVMEWVEQSTILFPHLLGGNNDTQIARGGYWASNSNYGGQPSIFSVPLKGGEAHPFVGFRCAADK